MKANYFMTILNEIRNGQKFGQLTVIKQVFNKNVQTHKNRYYLVRCSCGTEFLIRKEYLIIYNRTCCRKCSLKNRKISKIQKTQVNTDLKTKRQILKNIFNTEDELQQNIYFYVFACDLVNKLEKLEQKHVSCVEATNFINEFLNSY